MEATVKPESALSGLMRQQQRALWAAQDAKTGKLEAPVKINTLPSGGPCVRGCTRTYPSASFFREFVTFRLACTASTFCTKRMPVVRAANAATRY